jgi:hypothetical protein
MGGRSMGRRNRHGTRRLFAVRPRRGDGSLRFADVFSSEYRPLTIIEPASGANWAAPWIIIGTLIVLGAALIFVFAR